MIKIYEEHRQPVQPAGQVNGPRRTEEGSRSIRFRDLLERATRAGEQELHFSKHVQERLEQRNIVVDASQYRRLKDAVALAESKGVKDSLVLFPDTAFIVNIPNRTVVTALGRDETTQRVFTHIDGAVFY